MPAKGPSRSSIARSIVWSFVIIGLLMMLGGAIAYWQIVLIKQSAQRVYADDESLTQVLHVHTAFVGYQSSLESTILERNAPRLAAEAKKSVSAFDDDIAHARTALLRLPVGTPRDSALSTLDSTRPLFENQVESLIALAQTGDWNATRLRFEDRMGVIDRVSESLVDDVQNLVESEHRKGLADIEQAQRRATIVLACMVLAALIAALLLGLNIRRNVAVRLSRLDLAARALGRGEFDRPDVSTGGDDEISRLGQVFNDMAARLRVLYETLQYSEARFRSLIENAPDFILIVAVDGAFKYASPSSAKAFGSDALLHGANIVELVDPKDVSSVRRLLAEAPAEGEPLGPVEIRMRGADSRPRVLEVFSKNLVAEAAVSGIVLNARDVTGVRSLEEQLRQSQRLEAIGTLAGGVAHDFNNLLTVIRGYCDILMQPSSHDNVLTSQIRHIDQAAERAASLTRQLLAFSRRQVLEPKVFSLNGLVEDIDKMLRRMIGEDIQMTTALAPDLGLVKADPGQIEQVVMNLVINARDAMPEGGKLTLETSNVTLDDSYVRDHTGAIAGPYVVFSLSDTGTGMTPDTQKRIFEPFFTTKGEGKGTGLGLSTVYGIVKQSGGYVSVYSELGQGTCFKVYLPRVFEKADAREALDRPAPSYSGSETVLVVEDDPQIRELVTIALTDRGYTVLAPDGVDAAIAQNQAYSGTIHLLLTDIVMPGMSGTELAKIVSRNRPDIRVLFVSGYTASVVVDRGVLTEGRNFLQKPFTVTDLANKIRAVLDDRP